MGKDESIVKSFRISEEQFNKANDIFIKEGFSFSEVIRLVCDATIKEGRIPRGLSNKDMESKQDNSQLRESYIDSILSMVGVVPVSQRDMTPEERLLDTIFQEKSDSKDLTNKEIREWAESWGLPDNLSISTLADLYDCGLFPKDPWDGAYDAAIVPRKVDGANAGKEVDERLQDVLVIMECQNNIKDNLEQIKRSLEVKAIQYLMESNNIKEDDDDESN